jgi:hypothetical protein
VKNNIDLGIHAQPPVAVGATMRVTDATGTNSVTFAGNTMPGGAQSTARVPRVSPVRLSLIHPGVPGLSNFLVDRQDEKSSLE